MSRPVNEPVLPGPVTAGAEKHVANSNKFSFGHWIRLYGVDLITMAAMGAIGLGVYEADPAPSRSFPVYFQNGQIVYPEFAYPLRKEIVPIWAAALIAFFVPFFFFCLFQIRRRSMEDLLATTMGLLMGLINAAVFQVFLKWLIGGLRPHFYDVCKPNILPGMAPTGNGFGSIMYDRSICTGDRNQINDSLESFPSGHSTAGFAGLIFLALYFNAQLKVMSAHNPAYWKFILMMAPVLGATLIAGALTIDEFHNWYDVLAGAIIGTVMAFIAFRMTFASILDFRFNHLRLPRTSSLFLRRHPQSSAGAGASASSSDGNSNMFFPYSPAATGTALRSDHMPFSREGGWGRGMEGEGMSGAPFDASAVGGGSASGMGGADMMHGGVGNGVGGHTSSRAGYSGRNGTHA